MEKPAEARLRVNNVIGQLQCPTWTNINSADPRTTPTQGFHEDHASERWFLVTMTESKDGHGWDGWVGWAAFSQVFFWNVSAVTVLATKNRCDQEGWHTAHLLANHKTSSYHKPYYFQTWYHQDTQNKLNLTQKWATEPEADLKHNHSDHHLVCVK